MPSTLYEKYRPYKNYGSGEMKYFFGLLRKLRAWKVAAKNKDSNTISKLSQIVKIAAERREKEELVMNMIAKNKRNHDRNSIEDSSRENDGSFSRYD